MAIVTCQTPQNQANSVYGLVLYKCYLYVTVYIALHAGESLLWYLTCRIPNLLSDYATP